MKKELLCTYLYDPMDRLTGVNATLQSDSVRFYCQKRIATEVQKTTQLSVMQYGDQLLAQRTLEFNQPNTILLTTDLQRSLLNIIGIAEQQANAYSPYGHHVNHHLLGFNGERVDPVTGHYLLGNGYRAYNPILMRFNSPDSLSPFGDGGINAYSYCDNNPVNLSDSSGHTPSAAVLKAASIFRNSSKSYLARREKSYIFRATPKATAHVGKKALSQTVSRRHSFSEALPSYRTKIDISPDLDLVGFHGTQKRHAASLARGLNEEHLGDSNGLLHGRGFYSTPDYGTAKEYAYGSEPIVFGVYAKNFQAMKLGRDYDLKTVLTPRNGDLIPYTEIIFRKPAYDLITVSSNIRGKVIFPKSAEAPF